MLIPKRLQPMRLASRARHNLALADRPLAAPPDKHLRTAAIPAPVQRVRPDRRHLPLGRFRTSRPKQPRRRPKAPAG